MLELLYATGCRASEISNLKLHDLHLDEGYCVCRGKGDKQRMVPLGAKAAAAVRAYLSTNAAPWRRRFRRRRSGSCSPIAAAVCGASGSGSS